MLYIFFFYKIFVFYATLFYFIFNVGIAGIYVFVLCYILHSILLLLLKTILLLKPLYFIFMEYMEYRNILISDFIVTSNQIHPTTWLWFFQPSHSRKRLWIPKLQIKRKKLLNIKKLEINKPLKGQIPGLNNCTISWFMREFYFFYIVQIFIFTQLIFIICNIFSKNHYKMNYDALLF